MQAGEPESGTCEECGATIPVAPGYPPWCACGWNLHRSPPPTFGRLERLYARLCEPDRERLFERVREDGVARPELGLRDALVWVLSLLVLLSPPGLLALAVWFPLSFGPNIVTVGLALLVAAIAVATLPRGWADSHVVRTDADSHPRLHRLISDVARELETDVPDIVALSPSFEAYVVDSLYTRRRTLVLGVPLLHCLEAQSVVGLIGHEMGHRVNGDVRRRLVPSAAVLVLARWCTLLEYDDEAWSLGNLAWAILMLPVFIVAAAGLLVIVHLSWVDSVRAEFYADKMGARIAGTRGMTGVLETIAHPGFVRHAVQKVSIGNSDRPLFEEMRLQYDALPERERERRIRLEERTPRHLTDTHPPVLHRLRMLRSLPAQDARVRCSASERQAILDECERQSSDFAKTWLDEFEEHFYRGGR